MLLVLTHIHPVRTIGNAVVHALLRIELFAELIKIRDFQAGPEPDRSAIRSEIAEEQSQQCRFTGAVGANQPHAIAARHRGGEVANNHLLAARKGYTTRLGDQSARSLGDLYFHLRRAAALAPLAALHAERLEIPHPTFVARTTCLDAGADPHFLFRQLSVKLGELALLDRERSLFADQIRVVVGAPVHEPTTVELHNSGGDIAKKGPVVGHKDDRHPAVHEELFHPLHRFDVQVVGGLVEQEYVRLSHEGAR